jgi:endo-1,4-beta-mannosidase
LAKGWNVLTWQVPFEAGVNAIGLVITPVSGFKGQLLIDTVSWPDTFVRRSGTRLQVQGQDYRFDGINIYNANSTGNCWYSMADNGLLDDSLDDLPGLEVFRAWFFQSFATKAGARDWNAFDHTLQVAAAHHVKVIVTLGNQWGDCEPTGYKTRAWYEGGYAQSQGGELVSYRDWVQQVVYRYRNDPTIAFWQLLNEPEALDAPGGACDEPAASGALRAFTDDVGGVLHNFDTRHLVSLGALGSGQCGMAYTDYEFVHASQGTDLCEFHDYGSPATPIPGDQWNGLQMRLNQCNTNLGKPLFAGETGISVPDETATATQRAAQLDAKMSAQFGANVVGEVLWAWNIGCSTSCGSYDIGVGDPAVSLLSKY